MCVYKLIRYKTRCDISEFAFIGLSLLNLKTFTVYFVIFNKSHYIANGAR